MNLGADNMNYTECMVSGVSVGHRLSLIFAAKKCSKVEIHLAHFVFSFIFPGFQFSI